MPHTLQGKNKLDRNIHLNRNISEVKKKKITACSLRREERKLHTQELASEHMEVAIFVFFKHLTTSLLIDMHWLNVINLNFMCKNSWYTGLDWFNWLMNTDLAECCGPRRSVCSPLGSSQSRHRRTHWRSTPPELLSHRQTGSLQRGPPAQGPLQTQRATANTRETLIKILELESSILTLETVVWRIKGQFTSFYFGIY